MMKILDLALLNLALVVEERRTNIYCSLPCDKSCFRCLAGHANGFSFYEVLLLRNSDHRLFSSGNDSGQLILFHVDHIRKIIWELML
jgi:hypothetical protein